MKQKINFKQFIPLIIIDDKCHQILLNDDERIAVFNFIASLRGQIDVHIKSFCEVEKIDKAEDKNK
jgi:hypothetical protein